MLAEIGMKEILTGLSHFHYSPFYLFLIRASAFVTNELLPTELVINTLLSNYVSFSYELLYCTELRKATKWRSTRITVLPSAKMVVQICVKIGGYEGLDYTPL